MFENVSSFIWNIWIQNTIKICNNLRRLWPKSITRRKYEFFANLTKFFLNGYHFWMKKNLWDWKCFFVWIGLLISICSRSWSKYFWSCLHCFMNISFNDFENALFQWVFFYILILRTVYFEKSHKKETKVFFATISTNLNAKLITEAF